MSGGLIFRLRRRRAVSPIIGGVIILTLLLTALGTVVFVTQQYDQYQQTANTMAQYQNQQSSENLVANSPGLAIVNSTISGWSTSTSTCGTKTGTTEYNCYVATISNLGTVGVQIARIYINSTGPAGSGCSSPNVQPCILNPSTTIAGYSFDQANQFINTGETNHTVAFALPTGVALPAPSSSVSLPPQNSIVIVTSRGNVFSFQWPFQALPFLPTSAFSSGNMKVAYQGTGFDSSNEPSFTGKTTGIQYCHTEPVGTGFPVLPGYAEKLTGINGVGVTNNALYFVNPWITGGNSQAVITGSGSSSSAALHSGTTLYIYVLIVNTGSTAYTPTAGSLDLTWYGSNHIDGYLLGVYYGNSEFWAPGQPNPPTISPSHSYYAIFKIVVISTSTFVGSPPWATGVQPGSPSVMFWGSAAITNAVNNLVEYVPSESSGFFSGTILASGLWIRYEATTGSCA